MDGSSQWTEEAGVVGRVACGACWGCVVLSGFEIVELDQVGWKTSQGFRSSVLNSAMMERFESVYRPYTCGIVKRGQFRGVGRDLGGECLGLFYVSREGS